MINSFCLEVRIYYEDTDAGGVVYHASYLKFLERARTEWLRKKGITQSALLKKEQVVFVVNSIYIHYRKPASLDDILKVSCELRNIKNCSLVFRQQVTKKEQLLLSAEVCIACVTSNNFQIKKIPIAIKNHLFYSTPS